MKSIMEKTVDWNEDGPALVIQSSDLQFLTDEEIQSMKGPIKVILSVKLSIDDKGNPDEEESTTEMKQTWTNVPYDMLPDMQNLVRDAVDGIYDETTQWSEEIAESEAESGGDRNKAKEGARNRRKKAREEKKRRRGGRG